MFDRVSQDRVLVPFSGAQAGTGPLTWGQQAIWQDMLDSGNQFTMDGYASLPPGSTVKDVTTRLATLMYRHAALRMRLGSDGAGQPCQQVAGSGQIGLDVLTLPDEADPADVPRYVEHLRVTGRTERFDFERDWPLRMALLRHRGECRYVVWTLSHLAADGGAHVLLLDDLIATGLATEPRHPDILDMAQAEQEPQLRQLSRRAMRHWESQLSHLPAQTFGEPVRPQAQAAPRYRQARFASPAAHLAVLAIAGRTGTDVSRVTFAVIATAIARATGVHPLTIKVMVNNRFRPGVADVIAPLAQNAVVTIDVGGMTVDEAVTRTRNAILTASMRACYDPADLSEVMERLDAARGYPARVTCRVNDQRAMTMRAGQDGDPDKPRDPGQLTPERIRQRLGDSALTWLGRRDNMHEQVNLLVENEPDVVSLHIMWDGWSLTDGQVEAVLHGVEEVAVRAAFDPAAPTGVAPAAAATPAGS
jgi:Condensation domain